MKLTIQGQEKDVDDLPGEDRVEIIEREIYEIINTAGYIKVYNQSNNELVGFIAKNKHISIAKKHLSISIDDKVIILKDLGSTYGSYLDGEKFTETKIEQPGNYDLKLGNVKFKLKYEK